MQRQQELESRPGIYVIQNMFNNKVYIGSTTNILRRKKEHFRRLIKGNHCNCYLQAAYNKYENLLEFDVLEYCEVLCLPYMEQYWFNLTLCTNREFGYNLDKSAFNSGQHKLSDETKAKLSKAHLGKIIPRDIVEKVRQANTGQKRERQSKIMADKFRKGELKLITWNDFDDNKKAEVSKKLSIATKLRFSKIENLPKTRQELIMVKDGIETVFNSLHHAARELGVDRGGIKYAIKNNNGYLLKLKAFFKLKKNKVSGEK